MPTNISSLSGQYQFTPSSTDYLITLRGFGGGETVTSITGGFYVDLGIGMISDANITLCLSGGSCSESEFGNYYWPLSGTASSTTNFVLYNNGNLIFANEDNNVLTAYNNTTEYIIRTEDIAGMFLGSAAEGFVLSFESSAWSFNGSTLQAVADAVIADPGIQPDKSIGGSILFHASGTDFVIDASERNSFNRIGFALSDAEGDTGGGLLFGGTTDLGDNGLADQIITSTTSTKGDGLSVVNFSVMRQADAIFTPETGHPEYSLDWGVWESDSANNSVEFFSNAYDASNSNVVQDDIVVASFEPTGIANYTGSRSFAVTDSISDSNYSQNVSGSFDFDLVNKVINDFVLTVDAIDAYSEITDTWTTAPLDNIKVANDGLIFTDGLSGSISGGGVFTGRLRGGFAGTYGQGLVAAYNFDETGGSERSINGAALFEQSNLLGVAESAELSQVGFAVFNQQPNPELGFWEYRGLIGSASDPGNDGHTVIVELRDDMYTGDYANDPAGTPMSGEYYHILRRNNADLDSDPAMLVDVGNVSNLAWGVWDGDEGSNPFFATTNEFGNPDGLGDWGNISGPVLFATGDPADMSDLNLAYPSWGYKNFTVYSDSPMLIRPSDSSQQSFAIDSIFEMDFGAGNVTGHFNVLTCSGSSCSTNDWDQKWELNGFEFSLSSIGDEALFRFDTGISGAGTYYSEPDDSTPEQFNGQIYGFFTGATGDQISTGFYFGGEGGESTPQYPDSGAYISGLVLMEAMDYISSAQHQSVIDADHFGFLLSAGGSIDIGNATTVSTPLFGWTNSPGSNDDALLFNRNGFSALAHLYGGSEYFDSTTFSYAFQFDQENAVLHNFGTGNVGNFDVNWGIWGGDGSSHIDVFDSYGLRNDSYSLAAPELSVFASAPPAYEFNALFGTATFDMPVAWIGKYDSDGSQTAISGINAEFIMNLGGFSMTANELEICIGGSNCGNAAQRWVVDTFASIYAGEGVITGGSTSGDIYDSGDSIIDGFTADLNGFITVNGDNERALLLGFDMAADSSNDVVVGASLISASIDQAFIYDSSYRSNFTQFGFAISQDFSGIITGPVNPASSPQLVSFAGSGAQLSPQTRFNEDPYHILETSALPGSLANFSGSVDWYKWTSPGNHKLFNNPTTLSSYSEEAADR